MDSRISSVKFLILCVLTLFAAGPPASAGKAASTANPASAATKSVSLSVLGASDGQLKVLADQAAVATPILLQSNSDEPQKVTLRVSPFRDASGQIFAARIALAQNSAGTAADATASAESTVDLPPNGVVEFTLTANLFPEGEYSTELLIKSGNTVIPLKLAVTRAVRELGVDIENIDPVHATAEVHDPSTTELHVALREKVGRQIQLNNPVLIKFTRKEANGAFAQARHNLTGAPSPLALTPNQSLALALTLADLEGAGEYQGTLRISAPGSKSVDQSFTVTLRESRFVAFVAIFIGVAASAVLRWLTQQLRPRLLQIRRAQLILRQIDQVLATPDLDPTEAQVLRSLSCAVATTVLAIEADQATGVDALLDLHSAREALAEVWIQAHRRVEVLRPESLRASFRPTIDAAREVILSGTATSNEIQDTVNILKGLPNKINDLLREQLKAHTQELRDSLQTLTARPTSQIALVAPAELNNLLDQIDQKITTDLVEALRLYAQARQQWTGFLREDLDRILSGAPPPGMTPEDWRPLANSLKGELEKSWIISEDAPEAADRIYNRVAARYVAVVSDALGAEIKARMGKLQHREDPDEKDLIDQLTSIQQIASAARTAASAGSIQEALAKLTEAATQLATPVRMVRSAFWSPPQGALPPVSMPPNLPRNRSDDITESTRRIAAITRAVRGIDWLSLLIAALVATLLGIKTLWSPNPAWGGWEDWLVAVLWGLGLHQFTFAGVSALRDTLTGSSTQGKH